MPCILIRQIDEHTSLGVWEISENSAVLEKAGIFSLQEKNILSTFKSETRRQHWLSYRLLVKQLLNNPEAEIAYNSIGKPFVVNFGGFISVAHSGSYSAAIVSHRVPVGIDIEKIQPRVEKVAERYLSASELRFLDNNQRLRHLTILWAAKEAVYKMLGIAGMEFREQIITEKFTPAESGEFGCRVILDDKNEKNFLLHYFQTGNYFLVWTQSQ